MEELFSHMVRDSGKSTGENVLHVVGIVAVSTGVVRTPQCLLAVSNVLLLPPRGGLFGWRRAGESRSLRGLFRGT